MVTDPRLLLAFCRRYEHSIDVKMGTLDVHQNSLIESYPQFVNFKGYPYELIGFYHVSEGVLEKSFPDPFIVKSGSRTNYNPSRFQTLEEHIIGQIKKGEEEVKLDDLKEDKVEEFELNDFFALFEKTKLPITIKKKEPPPRASPAFIVVNKTGEKKVAPAPTPY